MTWTKMKIIASHSAFELLRAEASLKINTSSLQLKSNAIHSDWKHIALGANFIYMIWVVFNLRINLKTLAFFNVNKKNKNFVSATRYVYKYR